MHGTPCFRTAVPGRCRLRRKARRHVSVGGKGRTLTRAWSSWPVARVLLFNVENQLMAIWPTKARQQAGAVMIPQAYTILRTRPLGEIANAVAGLWPWTMPILSSSSE